MQSKELRDKRMKLVCDARAIVEKARTENRALSADEVQKYDAMMAEVDQLKATIDRIEAVAAADETRSAEQRERPGAGDESRANRPTATGEYAKVFWSAFRNSLRALMPQEFRALSVGSDAAGGFTVPDVWEKKLVDLLRNPNIMRQYATILTTSNGTTSIPLISSHGTASWTGEAGSYSASDEAFAVATLDAWKLTTLIQVSEELLVDSLFNLDDYIAMEFARRIGVAEEAAYVNGTGASQPSGIVAAASSGTNFASATVVTFDELITVFHSLPRYYRANATWLMSDAFAKGVRTLKASGTGQYLWEPSVIAGRPDVLLGKPVAISDNVPAPTTQNRSVIFGDLSYYYIADRQQTVVQRLNELYAANGQVGFRAYRRVDGKLIRTDAVVYGKQA